MNDQKPHSFIHLRAHSEYSLCDSTVRILGYVKKAVEDQMPAIGLTDLGNLFGMLKFYSQARKAGVKPIIGCDIWVCTELADQKAPLYRLLLLAKNKQGYLRLCDLITQSYAQPRVQRQAVITQASLADRNNQHLIALSAFDAGEIGHYLLEKKGALAKKQAQFYAQLFPDSFYLEVQRPFGLDAIKTAQWQKKETLIRATANLAVEMNLPIVATHPIQFLEANDFEQHEARVCISEGSILEDPNRNRHFHDSQYFLNQAQMSSLFSDLPAACENTIEIAKRCSLSLSLDEVHLPHFPTPAQQSLDDYLSELSHEGLKKRLTSHDKLDQWVAYEQRLQAELDTIQKTGFAGYFLIVADIIAWAKKEDIPVGPGRGSGAGSLVAWALTITDLDPLHYGLLFERFLNPERVSMPDFDIDFCPESRDQIILYVKNKYGSLAVSQIVTFGRMAARAVIRDVGRVVGLPYIVVDKFAKLIPNELNISLKEAIKKEPQIQERIDDDPAIARLWRLAIQLEGLVRNVGIHAGGVLIAPGKLTDFCPLYSPDSGQTTVSQFDKDDIEKMGLVKFDFLGLSTLTLIKKTIRWANTLNKQEKEPSLPLLLENIPLADTKTFQHIFRTGKTTAVFQFESSGMQELLKQSHPTKIEDLIALNALYRPGPMELIPTFVQNRFHPEKIDYPHPLLTNLLKETYGIMVYQEQVMQTAQIIAGYPLGGADLLRRAMGKKKKKEMDSQRAVFLSGAKDHQINDRQAEKIFDLMEKFAGYGFNKSHAAAYAVLAFQTAWLKTHHPAAFFSAVLTLDMNNTDKICHLYQDAEQHGLTILPPDINKSQYEFMPIDSKHIHYGLGGIKGTGENALSCIIEERNKNGVFTSIFDLATRTYHQGIHKRLLEALVCAGAFDQIEPNRKRVFSQIKTACELAEYQQKNAKQSALFDPASDRNSTALPGSFSALSCDEENLKDWEPVKRLKHEKKVLGFYLTGHPFPTYHKEATFLGARPLKELENASESLLCAGIVLAKKTQITRNGKMGVVMLGDHEFQTEISLYSNTWLDYQDKIIEDELIFIKTRRPNRERSHRIVVDQVLTLSEKREAHYQKLLIKFDIPSSADSQTQVQKLKQLLEKHPGACPVEIYLNSAKGVACLSLEEKWKVSLSDLFLKALETDLNLPVKLASKD